MNHRNIGSHFSAASRGGLGAAWMLALVLGAGCEKPGSPPPAAAPGPIEAKGSRLEAAPDAAKIFDRRCALCHGPRGAGDGPASAGLAPPPKDLGDPAWQSSVTDEQIEKVIAEGGSAVGRSPAMPAAPDLAGTPALTALREYIRSFARK